jgi:hypothetical protein
MDEISDKPQKIKKTKVKDLVKGTEEYKAYRQDFLLKRRIKYAQNPETFIDRTVKCRKEKIERDTLAGLLPKVKLPKIKIPKEVIPKIPGKRGRPRKDQLVVEEAIEKQRLAKLLK